MSTRSPVILGAARTPIGKFGGAFSELSAPDLGVIAAQAALARADVAPGAVQLAIFGQVLQGGSRMNPARQVSLRADVPEATPAMTINQVCASGLQAVALAAQHIQLGEMDVALAGGMESMSNAPYVLPDARWGSKLGHANLVDTLIGDGLWDAFEDCHMANTADTLAQEYGISREAQDRFAYESQQRYAAAAQSCHIAAEIAPVSVPQRRGLPQVVSDDEYPRADTTPEGLSGLRPAFKGVNTITAGNASGINDGAAAVVIASADWADAQQCEPLATLTAVTTTGVAPMRMGIGPAKAIRMLLEKTGLTLDDIDLIEINEAFAAQVLAVESELKWDRSRVNVNGGAIAVGHPIGASGARILGTLIYAMQRRNVRRGIAALCAGGGMGIAALVERKVH
ncbi:MAG: acetyl-CoA C-acetyltransferase [Chloroflexota bacterium]|nr:acetyl-CoA C-acetyltransferase [Chloroflexota bacterium]MDE2930967.1 acetyl-CoA C-acetyltransferase [Chloroflexota bacterium]